MSVVYVVFPLDCLKEQPWRSWSQLLITFTTCNIPPLNIWRVSFPYDFGVAVVNKSRLEGGTNAQNV